MKKIFLFSIMLLCMNSTIILYSVPDASELFTAIKNGDETKVQQLIADGVNINTREPNTQKTPLIMAAHEKKGTKKIVEFLLNNGPEINAQDNQGFTALMEAIIEGKQEIAKLLIDKNADLNIQNKNGETALMIACLINSIETVALLIGKSANINAQDVNGVTALMYACIGGNITLVTLLLMNDANPNIQTKEASVDFPKGYTALLYSIANNKIEISKALINDKTTNIHIKSAHNVTTLMLACKNRNLEIVELLLKKGALPNEQNVQGLTALMAATITGDLDVAKELIKYNADPNKTTSEEIEFTVTLGQEVRKIIVPKESTALMIASLLGYPELVKELMHAKTNVKLKDALVVAQKQITVVPSEIQQLYQEIITVLTQAINLLTPTDDINLKNQLQKFTQHLYIVETKL